MIITTDGCNGRHLARALVNKAKQSKAKQNNFYLLTQAGYVAAIQLIWACGITACALRIASQYSFTDLGRMDS